MDRTVQVGCQDYCYGWTFGIALLAWWLGLAYHTRTFLRQLGRGSKYLYVMRRTDIGDSLRTYD